MRPPQVTRQIKTALHASASVMLLLTAMMLGSLQAIPAHAAANTTAAASSCAVHEITLRHNQAPTIRCLKQGTSQEPYSITEDRCSTDDQLEIDTMYNGAYCFNTGSCFGPQCAYDYEYTGLSNALYQVTQVRSLKFNSDTWCAHGWVMAYEPPYAQGTGHQFTFASCTTYNSGNSMFNGDDKVTQVLLYYE